MAELAQVTKDQLHRIKQSVESAYISFKPNYERFHEFQTFAFKTALNEDDESTLDATGKPVIEANIVNAHLSRLCGEFSKQEPFITVSTQEGAQIDPKTIEIVEGHMRHIFEEAKKENTQYNVYRDVLAGGFSDFKVWTEYAHEMSFDQVIRWGRVYEPTLCGFDPMSRQPDKSDASYCFMLFPMTKKQFKIEFPKVDLESMRFSRDLGGFNWSFDTSKEEVVILCEYYEKKKTKQKIVKLSNNQVMTLDEYEEKIAQWSEMQLTAQPPVIVGKPRTTTIQRIVRYRLIGTEVLDYKMTDFKFLPIVFVDGDSVFLRDSNSTAYQQFTKPYIYHAKGIQRLKNFAMQCLGNDLESMVMHKFKVAKESIPQEEEYQEAYINPGRASTLVYNQFNDQNPDQQLNPPEEIARVGAPPEVMQAYTTAEQTLQNILGSYDAQLGIQNVELSGVAIVEGATQSNAAAMPYIVGYMQGLNQVAQIILDLIPKYYITPRTIPIIRKDGTKDYVKINEENGPSFNFDENALQVRVEAGPNFAIQKNQALQQIFTAMRSSEAYSQFINTSCLDVLTDNMEFKGSEIVAERAKQWMQEQKQQQQQAQQQPNPQMIMAQTKQAELQHKVQESQMDANLKQMELQLKRLELMLQERKITSDIELERERSRTELAVHAIDAHAELHDATMREHDMNHRHELERHKARTQERGMQ